MSHDPRLPQEALVESMPFAAGLGLTLSRAEPEAVEGSFDWSPSLTTAGGALHGGALMTLADSLGAICAFLNLPEGATTSTIESMTNFFRPVRAGSVTATSRPLHLGHATIVVQTTVRDGDGRLVAHTVQTQAVLRPGEHEPTAAAGRAPPTPQQTGG